MRTWFRRRSSVLTAFSERSALSSVPRSAWSLLPAAKSIRACFGTTVPGSWKISKSSYRTGGADEMAAPFGCRDFPHRQGAEAAGRSPCLRPLRCVGRIRGVGGLHRPADRRFEGGMGLHGGRSGRTLHAVGSFGIGINEIKKMTFLISLPHKPFNSWCQEPSEEVVSSWWKK